MLMIPLQSGSNGNCIYVESRGVRLLFDAGLNPKQVGLRLAAHGRTVEGIDGLFISHEHADHVRFAASLVAKHRIPLYMTQRTYRAAQRRFPFSADLDLRHFVAGQAVQLGPLRIETLPTPHDAVDGVVFVIDDGVHRLAICTDFGHVYSELRSLVASVDGLYLESNYDEQMLRDGAYPPPLKTRISGPRGHISNRDSALLVAEAASERLQWVCLAHLSAKNNTPALALETYRRLVGAELNLQVAQRYGATRPMQLSADMFQQVRRAASDPALAEFWAGSDDAVWRKTIRQRRADTPGGFQF